MALNDDGLNIVISGDASDAVKEIEKVKQATDDLKDQTIEIKVDGKVDTLGRLHKANGQFMTMGEKLAASFNSAFMKKAAEWSIGLDNFGKKLETGFSTVFKSISAGAASVAASLSIITKSALAIGGGFEAQMTTVKVISGATADELDALTKKAREMGATLPITAKNSAEAMTVLAQRGTNAKDILKTVEDVANLAISQGVSMANAADLLGSTLTNFSIAIDDAAKVTAIFNNASNQSALNMGKLTEALKYVGPTAGSIGMELTEAVAAMEALANAGLTGEMTVTGLAVVLTKLSSNARVMGVDTHDLQGNLRPLADIFSELQAKGMSLSEATAIFGARGRLAALNLAKQSDALKENEERLKQWGSTQAAVDEKSKTFTNTIAALQSALEELHIEIFEQIKSQAKDTASGFTQLVRSFSEWVAQSKIAEKSLNAFLNGLGLNFPSGENFKKLLDNLDIQTFVDKVQNFGVTIKTIAENIAAFIESIKSPLEFLIRNLDAFAKISFWGWITGKALQIPAILISLASSFLQLKTALSALTSVNLTGILAFFKNPIWLAYAAVVAAGGFAVKTFFDWGDAINQLAKAQDQEKRYLAEQAKANSSLDLDIKFNIKTGFEKLPQSWTKASDELREKANQDVQTIRDAFKINVVSAIDEVVDKFPELSSAFNRTADIFSNSSLSQLTKALQGNDDVFQSLPEHLKKLVEQLASMGIKAGQTTGDINNLIAAYKDLKQNISTSETLKKDEFAIFADEISASVNNIFEQLPDAVQRMQKFLGNNDLMLPVNLSISQAQEQIKSLSKDFAEKFNLPQEIVNSKIFSQLQTLAVNGNKTAQSLVNGWDSAGNSLNDFLSSAQEAINYLGASPDKFLPALNSLQNKIQKVDPLTGKLTEQFKKAHDALKQWANTSFDQLSQRIQRLRKAVEGGFIDKSALEAEAKNALQQIKVQVVADLQPQKNSFTSQSAYYSTVASEVYSRAFELGGDVFAEALRKEMANYYDQSGTTMGRAFVKQAENGLTNLSASMKINNIEVKNDVQNSDFNKIFNDLLNSFSSKFEVSNNQLIGAGQALVAKFPEVVNATNKLSTDIQANNSLLGRTNDSVNALINSLSNVGQSSNGNFKAYDYSSSFAQIIKEIQTLQNLSQANINAVNSVASAVSNNRQQQQNISIDSAAIAQAVVNGFNPVLNKLDSQSAIFASSTGSVAKNFSALQSSIDALKSATDSCANSFSNSQSTNENINLDIDFARALSPLVNYVQALSVAVSGIEISQQNNSDQVINILNAIKNLQAAVESLDTSNNFNVEINQQGFVVQKNSDADLIARNTASALRMGLANGGV